jgi:hypothetical protein
MEIPGKDSFDVLIPYWYLAMKQVVVHALIHMFLSKKSEKSKLSTS